MHSSNTPLSTREPWHQGQRPRFISHWSVSGSSATLCCSLMIGSLNVLHIRWHPVLKLRQVLDEMGQVRLFHRRVFASEFFANNAGSDVRSEEHTSELQSRGHL